MICLLPFSNIALGQSGVVVSFDTASIDLDNHFDILRDTNANLSFEQMRSQELYFKPFTHEKLYFTGEKNVYWARFSITNNFRNDEEFILGFNDTWDKVAFYAHVDDSFVCEVTGRATSFYERTLPYQFSGVTLLLKTKSRQTFYCRFEFNGDYNVPDSFFDTAVPRKSFIHEQEKDRYIQGIFLGIVIIMSCYNLFIFFSLKDKNYLYYVLMLLGMGMIFMANFNYSFEYLWPRHPQWDIFLDNVPLLGAFEGFWLLVFFQSFLKTRENLPVWHKIMNVVNALSILTLPVGFFHILPHAVTLSNILGILIFTIGLVIGIISYRRKYKPARFFLLGTVFSARGTILFLLQAMFHFIPFDIKQYPMEFGYTIDMIFFSFAIADRINILKKENMLAQKKIMEHGIGKETSPEQARIFVAADLYADLGQKISAAKQSLAELEQELTFTDDQQKLKFEKVIGIVNESLEELQTISQNAMSATISEAQPDNLGAE